MNGKLKILTSMAIFGTVGIFVRFIPMASAAIAWCRGVMGCVFLLLLMAITGKKPNLGDMKRNGWILAISGAAIGINWILLFEAYNYTTVFFGAILNCLKSCLLFQLSVQTSLQGRVGLLFRLCRLVKPFPKSL